MKGSGKLLTYALEAKQHATIEHTVRYLGVDVDDALTLSERTEL